MFVAQNMVFLIQYFCSKLSNYWKLNNYIPQVVKIRKIINTIFRQKFVGKTILHTCDQTRNWYNYTGKTFWYFLHDLHINILYNSTISLLGI